MTMTNDYTPVNSSDLVCGEEIFVKVGRGFGRAAFLGLNDGAAVVEYNGKKMRRRQVFAPASEPAAVKATAAETALAILAAAGIDAAALAALAAQAAPAKAPAKKAPAKKAPAKKAPRLTAEERAQKYPTRVVVKITGGVAQLRLRGVFLGRETFNTLKDTILSAGGAYVPTRKAKKLARDKRAKLYFEGPTAAILGAARGALKGSGITMSVLDADAGVPAPPEVL